MMPGWQVMNATNRAHVIPAAAVGVRLSSRDLKANQVAWPPREYEDEGADG